VTDDHIRLAVEVAGARRIGHGTDIAWERDARGTLAMMAARGVAVEHCLTSADVILGVRGAAHPWALYHDAGVAQVLCADDEGVARSDLSREYLRAVQDFAPGWTELKALARNALAHSFLPGASLWERGAMNAACRAEAPGAERPGAACAAWLATSERAREQWGLEGALRRFEAMW
jgi:adenosine deaminase